jgi:hypothetical protein
MHGQAGYVAGCNQPVVVVVEGAGLVCGTAATKELLTLAVLAGTAGMSCDMAHGCMTWYSRRLIHCQWHLCQGVEAACTLKAQGAIYVAAIKGHWWHGCLSLVSLVS